MEAISHPQRRATEFRTESPAARVRDPQGTREALLQAAFHEIYRSGFRAAGLDSILARAGVTKGALYHHFSSKGELGLAVLDEIIGPMVLSHFLEPIEASDDPVEALSTLIGLTSEIATAEVLELGCPLNNLAQEMSSVDELFRVRLASLFDEWRLRLAASLQQGQDAGKVRKDLNAESAAGFIVACWEGIISIGKTTRDAATVGACVEGFQTFVETLRPRSSSDSS